MTDGTTAVPTSLLTQGGERRALCPACVGGRLHPYRVELNLGGWQGFDQADGWVAVCDGSQPDLGESDEPAEPCGFAMPITPHRIGWST